MKKTACPACGALTIENPGWYNICQVCNWEDDPSALRKYHRSEVNGGFTLINWRKRYLKKVKQLP